MTRGFELQVIATARGIVKREYLSQDDGKRASVQQHVGEAPDTATFGVGQANQRHPHQRCPAEVDPLAPLRFEPGMQALLLESCRNVAPVLQFERYGNGAMDFLDGVVEPVPPE